MAHSLSAKKRIRQNPKRRARNRARKRLIRTDSKALDDALTAGDAGKASDALRAAVRRIDRVAAKGTLHKNAAGRKKAKLQRKFNALAAKA